MFRFCKTCRTGHGLFFAIIVGTGRSIGSFWGFPARICRRSWRRQSRTAWWQCWRNTYRGDSLAYLLEGALFSPAEARKIALQLCSALWVLHKLGAVHRDIKPENVIIRGREAVLIDFDASRIFKSETNRDTQILGTTGYAAPEQYGITQTDERADIYSLGVLLNIMLTGKHPSRELASGRLGRIVQKCTMVNPEKRYKSALYLMEAL